MNANCYNKLCIMKDIKRREFIKMSAGAGVASFVIPGTHYKDPEASADISADLRTKSASAKKIIVAGASIAGL